MLFLGTDVRNQTWLFQSNAPYRPFLFRYCVLIRMNHRFPLLDYDVLSIQKPCIMLRLLFNFSRLSTLVSRVPFFYQE